MRRGNHLRGMHYTVPTCEAEVKGNGGDGGSRLETISEIAVSGSS